MYFSCRPAPPPPPPPPPQLNFNTFQLSVEQHSCTVLLVLMACPIVESNFTCPPHVHAYLRGLPASVKGQSMQLNYPRHLDSCFKCKIKPTGKLDQFDVANNGSLVTLIESGMPGVILCTEYHFLINCQVCKVYNGARDQRPPCSDFF